PGRRAAALDRDRLSRRGEGAGRIEQRAAPTPRPLLSTRICRQPRTPLQTWRGPLHDWKFRPLASAFPVAANEPGGRLAPGSAMPGTRRRNTELYSMRMTVLAAAVAGAALTLAACSGGTDDAADTAAEGTAEPTTDAGYSATAEA